MYSISRLPSDLVKFQIAFSVGAFLQQHARDVDTLQSLAGSNSTLFPAL
jgi:hypothetical protein